jgi:hypothetical protein
MLIHIKRNAEVFGPYSIEEAREYLSVGRLSQSDFAQLPGTTEWIPLASVPGIKSAPPPPIVREPTVTVAGSEQQVAPLPTATQPARLREQEPPSGVRIGPVLRDVAMIAVLTAMGGFVAGVAGHGGNATSYMWALEISNAIFMTLGFTISGCLATGNRWRHLAYVALGAWVVGINNVFFFGFTVEQWMLSAFFVAFVMAVGGGLSFLFKRS